MMAEMRVTPVSDSLSNRPEHIKEAVLAIGRSGRKRKVFEAVYHHKRLVKSVAEIMEKSGLTRMQVLQAGNDLVKSGIIEQTKKGAETAYRQISFFQHNKRKILSLVDNPEKLDKIATKREPLVSFEKPKPNRIRGANKSRRGGGERTAGKLRIAFMATNPDDRVGLRTDIEAREVMQAIRNATHRASVEVRYFPAARPMDLIDALNEFKPNVVHFSGHGGNEALLFDDESLAGEGGVEIKFDVVKRILFSVGNPPEMIVFNACDTLEGAEIFLDRIKIVVAMSSSILDISATVFSARFFQTLAESQPVQSALEQAKIAIELAGLGDAERPSVRTQDGIDLSKYILVK